MKFSMNRSNGGYVGTSEIHPLQGIMTVNKLYSEYAKSDPWMYPTYWIPMPAMGPTAQEFAGIFYLAKGASGNSGASADSNYAAFLLAMSGTGRTYTVDWGNGVTTSHASNTVAQRQYNWADFPGTDTPEGYRQVLIRAYPQPHPQGATLTTITLNSRFSAAGVTLPSIANSPNASHMWAYIKMAGVGISSVFSDGWRVGMKHLALIEVATEMPVPTSGQSAFFNGYSLRWFAGLEKYTRNLTNMNSFFEGCRLMTRIPWADTGKVTSFLRAFNGCSKVKTIPPLDFSKSTSFDQTFQSCVLLEHLPKMNTSSATNTSAMFNACYSLREAPEIDTSNVTLFTSMFQGCANITTVPLYNTVNGGTFASMFQNCASLREIPKFNFQNARSLNGFAANCKRLKIIPEGLSTGNVRDWQSAFTYNQVMVFPAMDYTNGTQFQNMLLGSKTVHVKGFSAGAVVNNGYGRTANSNSMFRQNYHLRRFEASNLRTSISLAGCMLSATAINEIFTGLPTVSGTTYNIHLTGNWGTGGCCAGIATSKGWTVTLTGGGLVA